MSKKKTKATQKHGAGGEIRIHAHMNDPIDLDKLARALLMAAREKLAAEKGEDQDGGDQDRPAA